MSLRTILPFASLLFLLSACGGSTTSDPSTASTPAAAASGSTAVPNVGDVSAVRVADLRPEDAAQVIASRDPAKVQKVIALLGLDGALEETTSFPNCIPSAKVELFDAAGKVAATVDVYCGGASIMRTAAGKAYSAKVADLDVLTKLEGDRLLVATWLYEITKVEIDQPLKDQHRVLETRAEIDAAVAALSPVETFDPNAPRHRCAADYAVTFTRTVGEGDPIVSRLFITCGSDPQASQPAWFAATDELQGQVVANAQTIAALASAE